MQKNLLVLMFSVVFSLLATNGHTQDFRISNYGVLEGVCHPFVYTVVQDNGGFIWLGTGNGLCKFDGFIFQPVQIPDSLSGKVIETGFRDSNGYMWFGSNSGELFYFTDEGLKLVSSDTEISGSITGFTEIDNNTLAVSTMNQGIFTVNSETGAAIKLSGINEGLFTCVYFENNLLISGSQTGLYIYSLDANSNKADLSIRVNELEYIRVEDIKKSSFGDFYWIATEDAGLFQLELSENNYNLISVKGDEIFTDGNIQSVIEDNDGRIWISTLLKGLYMASNYDIENGLSDVINFSREYNLNGNAVKSVTQDKSGNIWMASYGHGISLFTEQMLTCRLQNY